MKYISTLLAVKDIISSQNFYCDLLEQKVVADFGVNITMSGGFALQTDESWREFIHKSPSEIAYANNASELYFEVDDIDSFAIKLDGYGVEYVHSLQEHAWGQRVVRFYDPDKHIIEVGENLAVVAKRFFCSGMTSSQIATRMGIPLTYIEALLK